MIDQAILKHLVTGISLVPSLKTGRLTSRSRRGQRTGVRKPRVIKMWLSERGFRITGLGAISLQASRTSLPFSECFVLEADAYHCSFTLSSRL